MRRGMAGLAASALTLGLAAAHRQEAPKSLEVLRIDHPIKLDGRLDDPEWARAPVATGFTQTWPEYGAPARRATEVRILCDGRSLYVGARLRHSRGDNDVVRRLHRRDQDSSSDWFGVFVDSLHDHRSGYGFWVNAAGVQKDAVLYADTRQDSSWDGVWESAVSVDAEGWSAELRIPLSLLRVRGGVEAWGVNFSRQDQGRIRESSQWQVPDRSENSFVSSFPELRGLGDLAPRPRRDFAPFLAAEDKFRTAQIFDDRGRHVRAGADAHLSLDGSSQLDLSLRPDFGQVEVDQAVLNLGTVETYFPEKRAFFLEGSDLFRTNAQSFFYSRRIGAAVEGYAPLAGEQLLSEPLLADLNGAAKYTLKGEGGFDLGLLGANVGSAEARILDIDGLPAARELAPSSNYGVLRAQQSLDAGGSYIGAFGSWLDQAGTEGRQAAVGALDGTFKSQDRSSTLSFALGRSAAGPKGAELQGAYGSLSADQLWEGGWELYGRAEDAGHDFEINDVGYMPRADYQSLNLSLGKQWDATWGAFRNWSWNLGASAMRDQRGANLGPSLNLSARTDFTNFWSLWGGAALKLPSLDDRELRTYDDPVKRYLRYRSRPSVNVGFDTPGNKPWYLRASLNREWEEGGPSTDGELFQSIKPLPALELQLDTSLSRNEGERHWLETQGQAPGLPGQSAGTPLTGLRRLSGFNQVLRVSYAFSPTLTVQMFSQWLEDNWDFRDLKAYQDDATLLPASTPDATAFSYRLWNLNLITRWEFRPGSTFFLVYTHGADTSALVNERASINPQTDLSILRTLPSDDVVQMKVTWLF